MSDRYLLISADGHAGPPAAVYRDYLDPAFRERFDDQLKAMEELRALSPFASGEKSDFQLNVGASDRRRWRLDCGV